MVLCTRQVVNRNARYVQWFQNLLHEGVIPFPNEIVGQFLQNLWSVRL